MVTEGSDIAAADPAIAPETAGEAVELFMAVIEAGKAGNWFLFGGLFIMFLIWLAQYPLPIVNKSILDWVPGKALPWVTVGVSCLATVVAELTVGAGKVGQALWAALLVGPSAIALRELVGETVLPEPPAKTARKAAPAEAAEA